MSTRQNYNGLSNKLKEANRIIIHEENVFFEKGKFDRSEDFHPKPSVGINTERSLIVMQIFTVISQGTQFYEGIIYDNSFKAVAIKTEKNEDGGENYSEQRDILNCNYMSEFGHQVAIITGNTKLEIIEKLIKKNQ